MSLLVLDISSFVHSSRNRGYFTRPFCFKSAYSIKNKSTRLGYLSQHSRWSIFLIDLDLLNWESSYLIRIPREDFFLEYSTALLSRTLWRCPLSSSLHAVRLYRHNRASYNVTLHSRAVQSSTACSECLGPNENLRSYNRFPSRKKVDTVVA
ncbi:hypothetical protein ASPZODRAFT_134897 [Penicilliopsis zonata CBS 506.65]|uniref:Uncharacterized protein n=1 Tax=Penicilliopsis zonata CBS 506.65 TaxID=1073090 RepID=A0A1L9SCB4_9EURO|nr:hypothetical protein ASPZODRAFT_134897 [Penicilliopsis zonata CBS 506.65]OJJ44772.1 hypothetical protein ASPZODRAFT_134897 [Penicilliopsis zonata CBS 506.65]